MWNAVEKAARLGGFSIKGARGRGFRCSGMCSHTLLMAVMDIFIERMTEIEAEACALFPQQPTSKNLS